MAIREEILNELLAGYSNQRTRWALMLFPSNLFCCRTNPVGMLYYRQSDFFPRRHIKEDHHGP